MSQLSDDVLRALQMGREHVSCVTVSDRYLLWCGSSSRGPTMHLWDCRDDAPPIAPVLHLGFTPTLISLFQEKIVVVGEEAVALFTLEWSPLAVGDKDKEEEEEEEDEEEQEQCVVAEEFVCRSVGTGVTHVAWTPDGATVALSSPEQIVLVDCRVGCTVERSDANGSWPCLAVDCSSWYGTPGAAFSAFSASRLFVISTHNHLVSTRYNGDNPDSSGGFCSTEPLLERDGHILSRAHHVTSFAVGGSAEGHLVVGTSDGMVKLLQQESLEVFFTVDVTKQLYRIWDKSPLPPAEEGGVHVLNLAVGNRLMLVVRPDAVVCYNKNSMDLLVDRTTMLSGELSVLSACSGNGSWCVWCPQKQELLYYAAAVEQRGNGDTTDDLVHAQVPLPSRLLEPLLLPFMQQALPASGSGRNAVKNMKKKNVEKPVTFGHPIKSSGYASNVPWSVQQREKQLRDKARKATRPLPSATSVPRFKAVPLHKHPLQPMTTANQLLLSSPVHRAVVVASTFSACGAALLTSSGDTTASWLKYPVVKNGGSSIIMRAHKGPVNAADVSLSINAPMAATGSADGVVAMWQPLKREAPYIKHVVGKEVRAVKFFYTDKFLCYAAGNTVSLCRYALDNGGGDLNRKRNDSRVESVLEFTAESAQYVAALDAINYFTSNLLVWAGSNKSVGIYDVAAERNIQVVEEAHTRSIHHVAMMTASRYASPTSAHLHMYLTAGLDSTVRLWDLRQPRPVRQLALHRNSAAPVGVAFSPNGALVAVGSDIREVCIYDVGSGAALDKVSVGDIPTALCWHPIESVLAVGTANGTLQLLGQR
ncbi:putative WD repeat-containing protein 27-like [Trypanosoma grayi]|uniref:putative WD repeat-containing protein 27-like n=1 Tax=Trypanosoma grayi TaxID=71804 RepID=UPI0004F48459|nr:putative WD repeat-containing protein 27-like [Trypanosoma grayi]KEG10899.1 putative WD repeat-containing protein 27-like [Trypanosoma grayi]